jgi:hypothetical protein
VNDATQKRKRYSTGPQVLERYGGRSAMWLWRREHHDPKWPKPVVIGGRKFYDEDELDAYDAASKMEARDVALTS